MRSYTVYILRCCDGSFYTGITNNTDRRLAQHQAGKASKYTRAKRPVEIVFTQEFGQIGDALRAEIQIKGWRREKKLALIEGRLLDIPLLSRTEIGLRKS